MDLFPTKNDPRLISIHHVLEEICSCLILADSLEASHKQEVVELDFKLLLHNIHTNNFLFMALGHSAWQPTIDAKGFQSNLFNSSERVTLPVIIVFKHPGS